MASFPRRGAWLTTTRALPLVAVLTCAAPATSAGLAPTLSADEGSNAMRDPPTTHLAMGTIVSITSQTLVLRHTVHGRQLSETFRLTPATGRVGSLHPGVKVTVQYQVEQAIKRATFVKAPQHASGASRAGGGDNTGGPSDTVAPGSGR